MDQRAALSELLQIYWRPLFAFLLRRGLQRADAEDLIQSFCARLLAGDPLGEMDSHPGTGRFRWYLQRALDNHLANDHAAAAAQKRGGTAPRLSLDADTAAGIESDLRGRQQLSPEQAYERRWALTVLERALLALEDEQRKKDRHEIFLRLRPHLEADPEAPPYAQVAASMGISEGATKVLVHRLRQRFREIVRDQIGHTLEDPREVEAELQALIAALQD